MKKLSIEQKARRYDEAKLRMSAAYNSNRCTFGFMNEIFPELKESEDEMVRKALICRYQGDGCLCNNNYRIDYKEIRAWLEKQGEHARFREAIQVGDQVAKNDDGVLVNLSQLKRVAKKDESQCQTFTKKDVDDAYLKGIKDTKNEIEKQYEANYQTRKDIATFIFNYKGDIKDRAKWIDYLGIKVSFAEKQGEQKPCMIQWKGNNLKEVIDFTGKDKNFEKWFKSFEEYEKYVDDHNGIFKLFNADGSHYEIPVGAWIVKTPDGYNVASKAKYKQKSADKTELKFNIEDWVVYDHRAYQVVALPKEGYTNLGLRGNGRFEVAPSTYCRHWTIEDAKDGDVLSYRDGQWIFILKRIIDKDSFEYYTLWSTIHNDLTINDSAFSLLINSIYPATKEQRDILFSKMKEAGYKWDGEKKELKKIEQKPNYCHHEVDLSDCSEEYRKAYYDGWNNCNQQHAQLGTEQNPTWSEEKRKEFIGELQSLMFEWSNKKENMGVCIDRHIDKLLSIVSDISDLKPAWSEEDSPYYDDICEILINLIHSKTADVNKDVVQKDLDWFVSLKERVQPQQEWSEEDEKKIDFLRNLIRFQIKDSKFSYGWGDDVKYVTKEEAVDILTSLRPQSQWKPSDEQMLAINTAINILGKGTLNGKHLIELQEYLKKLKG